MPDAQLAVQTDTPAFLKASDRLSHALGIPVPEMLSTIKAQCFRGSNPDNISNAQLAAFVSIANEMGVNPFLPGMLYAYPSQGAIVPMMGPDGVYKKLSEHPEIDSWETTVFPEDVAMPPTHATTKIWRKGRERPLAYTALLSEWKVNTNPNWNSRTRHMLGLRSLKQAARQIIHGIPHDEDERTIMGEINVTPQGAAPAEPVPERPAPRKRSDKGVAAVKEHQQQAPIDIPAQTVAEATQPVTESGPAQEAPVVSGPSATPEPKGEIKQAAKTLKDGEKGVFICSIVDFAAYTPRVKGSPTPTIKAEVSGEYAGTVYHVGGATIQGDKAVAPAAWQLDKKVRLALRGEFNQAMGKVAVMVESVEIAVTDEM